MFAEGGADVVVGARSVIFASIPDDSLGLVIVDEEYEFGLCSSLIITRPSELLGIGAKMVLRALITTSAPSLASMVHC